MTTKEGVCMMNGVSSYGMMNSQVNFEGKRTNLRRKTLRELKTPSIQSKTVKIENFEKKLNTKVEEIMSRLKDGQITYNEALDALINLKASVPMQIKKFEAFI